MTKVIDNTNLGYLISKIKSAFWGKSETTQVSIDNTPTANSNNLVKSGGVYSAIDSKYTKPAAGIPASDLESGAIPTVPTISTNIQTDKASNVKTASPKAVYDEVHPAIVSTQPQGGFLPNVLYNLGTITGAITFSLATPTDATITNHYYWTFDTGSTVPTITWPAGLTWVGSTPPTILTSTHYEISVLNNVAVGTEV